MVIKNIDFEKYNKMAEKSFYRKLGKVVNVVGLTIESAGPDSKLGDLCRILPDAEGARPIMAEVVGFRDKKTLLMPYDSVDGIGLGCVVENTGDALKVTVNDKLLGKTVNGLGVPIDGEMINGAAYPVEAAPPDPMSRTIIDQVLPLGVKAVDGMITVGKGQRIGIFAGSGVGKSTLMGMFARNTKADINVIALIGERERYGNLLREIWVKKVCADLLWLWQPPTGRLWSVTRRPRQLPLSRNISEIRARMSC